MPVGNDVVDLRDPDNQPAALHRRFDLRVFDDEEHDLLSAACNVEARHRLRWTMWAAKECALKYLRQIEPGLPFRPREFAVTLDSSAGGRVVHRGAELGVALDVTRARVHAVAAGPPGVVGPVPVTAVARIERARPAAPADASIDVRRLAARELERLLDLPAGSVDIHGGARTTAPRARHDGEELPVELSLSHDGAWMGCAVATLPSG